MSESAMPSQATLEHLKHLVSFDTRNPPRDISVNSDIFAYLREHLTDFDCQIFDSGDGCLSLLAVRGKPQLLFNFHIDTVPVAQGWQRDPFKLELQQGKAFALGACDIKGATACMLSAINQTQGDIALLFSSDEEHGSSTAIKQFLKMGFEFATVIVAEPTLAQAVVAHRGIQSAKVEFKGVSGHASEARAYTDSAVHKAVNWCSSALEWVRMQEFTFDKLHGLPFNIGKIEGGVKANMIAASAELTFGFRPLPGQDSEKMLVEIQTYAQKNCQIKESDCLITNGFKGPTLPAANQDFIESINRASVLSEKLGLTIGDAVNFWTEASLFSEAGYTAIVFGPGDIKQAHTADEWVAIEQLALVEKAYLQIINLQNNSTERINAK